MTVEPAPRKTNGGAGGRPTELTPDTVEAVLAVVRNGVPWHYTAATAKVSTRTLYTWMNRGQAETERLTKNADAEPDDKEAIYADFFVQVEQAYQLAVQRNLMYIQQAARGGYVTEKSTRKNRDGSVEETEKKTAPDWRAAAKFLQYADQKRFGDKPQQVEMSGPGGGAIQVEDVSGIAARIAARQAALENTIDAEEVTDGTE